MGDLRPARTGERDPVVVQAAVQLAAPSVLRDKRLQRVEEEQALPGRLAHAGRIAGATSSVAAGWTRYAWGDARPQGPMASSRCGRILAISQALTGYTLA